MKDFNLFLLESTYSKELSEKVNKIEDYLVDLADDGYKIKVKIDSVKDGIVRYTILISDSINKVFDVDCISKFNKAIKKLSSIYKLIEYKMDINNEYKDGSAMEQGITRTGDQPYSWSNLTITISESYTFTGNDIYKKVLEVLNRNKFKIGYKTDTEIRGDRGAARLNTKFDEVKNDIESTLNIKFPKTKIYMSYTYKCKDYKLYFTKRGQKIVLSYNDISGEKKDEEDD